MSDEEFAAAKAIANDIRSPALRSIVIKTLKAHRKLDKNLDAAKAVAEKVPNPEITSVMLVQFRRNFRNALTIAMKEIGEFNAMPRQQQSAESPKRVVAWQKTNTSIQELTRYLGEFLIAHKE